MVLIPKQLQNPSFRFVKIHPKEKKPFEPEWNTKRNYAFNDAEFQKWLSSGGNYGVLCGIGNIVVIDSDKHEMTAAVNETLPKTFAVRTGGGGTHDYFICSDLDKKIVVQDSERHYGECQWLGQQVVGPTSIHPNGNAYEVIGNEELASITSQQIKAMVEKLVGKKIELEKEQKEEYKKENAKITGDIMRVIDVSKMMPTNEGYQGVHPVHGSTTGMNFAVNTTENIWHCFRHNCGGGIMQAIAMVEGITECGEKLRGDKFKKAVKVAGQKYGVIILPTYRGEVEKYFDERGRFIAKRAGDDIMQEMKFVTAFDNEECFYYDSGVYKTGGEKKIKEEVDKALGEYTTIVRRNEVINYIKTATYKDRRAFNSERFILNLQNGLLDIRTKRLLTHTPEIISTTQLPLIYDSSQNCPQIKQFFNEVVVKEDVPVLEETCGYCLYGAYPIHKAVMLTGAGSNGKSVFLNLLKIFLGDDNTCSISLQDLGMNRFASSSLYGKLANIYPDLSSKSLHNTGAFKILTGGDRTGAEKKFGAHFEFENTAKLIFSCNDLPATDDDTDAFFRRWIFVNFPNTFSKEKKNLDERKLEKITTKEELSGLLNVALDALDRLIARGVFSKGLSTEETREKYLTMSDSVAAYCMNCLDQDSTSSIEKQELYNAYCEYCREKATPTVSQGTFFKGLPKHFPVFTEHGKNNEGKRVWMTKGVKFRESSTGNEATDNDLEQKTLSRTGCTGSTGFSLSKLQFSEYQERDNNIEKPRTSCTSCTSTTFELQKSIIEYIAEYSKTMDSEGISIIELTEHFGEEIRPVIYKLLKDGMIFEPHFGRLRAV